MDIRVHVLFNDLLGFILQSKTDAWFCNCSDLRWETQTGSVLVKVHITESVWIRISPVDVITVTVTDLLSHDKHFNPGLTRRLASNNMFYLLKSRIREIYITARGWQVVGADRWYRNTWTTTGHYITGGTHIKTLQNLPWNSISASWLSGRDFQKQEVTPGKGPARELPRLAKLTDSHCISLMFKRLLERS